MVDVPSIPQPVIDDAVDEALAKALSGASGDSTHLARAVIAERVAAVAKHRARDEVAAALDQDGLPWEQIASAFGLSAENARQHFGPTPAGLPE